MNFYKTRLGWQARVLLAIALLQIALASAEETPQISRSSKPHPGGIPGAPIITGISRDTNGLRITWDGPSGDYQLFQKSKLTDPHWQPVRTNRSVKASSLPPAANSGIFRIAGVAPPYAGSLACLECHNPIAKSMTHTAHSTAFSSPLFVAQGGQTDPSCLVCHTVGYGLATGFKSLAQTPHLANVQCENCHGPAASHAANPEDPAARPRVERSSSVCGGCHASQFVPARATASHPPLYEEWKSSAHASMVECSACHDPHQKFVHTNLLAGIHTNFLTGFVITNRQLGSSYTNQIRAPLASLAEYHSSGNFPANYHPGINLCAQCHNDRGASAKSVAAPPPGFAQYNMLLGAFRKEDTGLPSNRAGSHALLEKQCVACHMQSAAGTSGGHTFKVTSYESCASCHVRPELLVDFTTNSILYQVQRDKAALELWAGIKAPPALQKYGANAWEYSSPGALSSGGPSPALAEQALIPEKIQKARFLLYLVYNEGSLGVHNGPYTVDLLLTAYDLILDELRR